jgi:hypothetical protein
MAKKKNHAGRSLGQKEEDDDSPWQPALSRLFC